MWPSVFVACHSSAGEVGVCVCVERGMVSKHRRVTGSGIACSVTATFSSCALLSMIMSAPVSDGPQSSRVSEILAPTGPVGHFSQAEAKATVQIKSLRDRPITIQPHTP